MATDATLDPDVLRPLFATPPPEFVTARNALAKQLRADKQRDTAALVAKLRRPGWVDWALNAAAADEPDLVGDFADAAEVLREAQAASIEGRDGPDLRGALRAQRDATTALGRRAGSALRGAGRPPDTADVVARLGEVAAQAEAVDQLRLGVLGSAEPGDDDLFGGLVPATPARKAATAPRQQKAQPRRKAAPEADADAAAAREAAAAAARAEAEARDAERAAERERLEEALATAEREREQAAAAVEVAEAALADARAALKDAQATVKTATTALRRATRDR
jgi:hypothetical protein